MTNDIQRVDLPTSAKAAGGTLAAPFRSAFSLLTYPIETPDELVKALKAVARIPISFFPITSAADFEAKAGQLLQGGSGAAKTNPTAVPIPGGPDAGTTEFYED